MKNYQTSSLIWWLVSILLLFLLSGCGANVDQRVIFLENEAWESEISLGFSADTLNLLGTINEIDQQINDALDEAEALGIKASWDSRRSGSDQVYTINMEGEGLVLLNQAAFEGGANISSTTVDGEEQIHFSYNPGLLAIASYDLTLEGKEILSSNGNQLSQGRVQWINPSGTIQAVLTPRGRFQLVLNSPIGIGIAGIVILGGGIFLISRNRTRAGPCNYCGTPLERGAQYCYICGEKR